MGWLNLSYQIGIFDKFFVKYNINEIFHDIWNFFSRYVATEFITNLHVIIDLSKYRNFEYTLLEILEFRAVCSFIEFHHWITWIGNFIKLYGILKY